MWSKLIWKSEWHSKSVKEGVAAEKQFCVALDFHLQVVSGASGCHASQDRQGWCVHLKTNMFVRMLFKGWWTTFATFFSAAFCSGCKSWKAKLSRQDTARWAKNGNNMVRFGAKKLQVPSVKTSCKPDTICLGVFTSLDQPGVFVSDEGVLTCIHSGALRPWCLKASTFAHICHKNNHQRSPKSLQLASWRFFAMSYGDAARMPRKGFKLVLLGDASVGKSSILMRFLHNKFSEEIAPQLQIVAPVVCPTLASLKVFLLFFVQVSRKLVQLNCEKSGCQLLLPARRPLLALPSTPRRSSRGGDRQVEI